MKGARYPYLVPALVVHPPGEAARRAARLLIAEHATSREDPLDLLGLLGLATDPAGRNAQ